MGTRGVFGFHKNGVDKIAYNHYDSYPSELGNNVKDFIKKHSLKEMDIIFDRIMMIDDDSGKPSEKQIKECEPYTDLCVSDQSVTDWYCLLHKAQGNLEAYADGLKYMVDYAGFLKDSLFCEWGYVINLTTKRLEIYRGFQHKPQENRYKVTTRQDNLEKHGEKNGYFNCVLIREIPLSQVRNFDMNAFEKEIEEQEDEE